jgi:RNA-binding protein YlmH
MADGFFAEALIPLEVRGSGYRTLTHRDYLGAILNLGIEREALGDLCVCDEHHAILFCDAVMCRFLCENLTRVANDAVRVTPVTLPAGFDGCRKFRPVTDTVASPRLDSVVAALASLSRERAQELIRAGAVELDFQIAQKADKPVAEGAVIVVRGKGKFIVRALSDKTKKGRFRLAADQYL